MARHHELPTRLLDWTANALFALSFACAGDNTKAGRVWAMRRRQGTDDQDLNVFKLANYKHEEKLFKSVEPCSIRIIYPFYNSPRPLAQDGAFTIHSPPRTPLEALEKSFKKKNLDIEKLYWWKVPAEKKTLIVEQLSELGVTRRSMFPDLDGVARSLWETEVLWNGAL